MAVFFNRLGEIRDRSFEQQRYRASGLNLGDGGYRAVEHGVLERATRGLVEAGKPVDGELLQFLSPLGWEHINLTGDYVPAAEPQTGRREVSGPYGCPENLSVRFFRILRAPLNDQHSRDGKVRIALQVCLVKKVLLTHTSLNSFIIQPESYGATVDEGFIVGGPVGYFELCLPRTVCVVGRCVIRSFNSAKVRFIQQSPFSPQFVHFLNEKRVSNTVKS